MLKIIRVRPFTKHVKSQPQVFGTNIVHKNRKFGLQTHLCLSGKRHICSVSSYNSPNRSPFEGSRNVLSTNFTHYLAMRPKPISLLGQKRNFSFQSSIESIAATQSGIFKTLSESTPVEYCQKFLLSVHDFTCLPWWASIIVSTIIVRSVVTLPLAIYQQSIIARLENLKLELPALANELKRETALAIKMYKWDEKTARATYNRSIRKQWNNLIVRDNCHPLKSTVLIWFQLPLWVSLSVSLRNLVYMLPISDINAHLTFSELMVGGFAFIPNLTIPDFSWIFPVSLGIINLAIIEIQVLSRNPNMQNGKLQKFITNAIRGLSIFMIPIGASVPSCLVLYWTTSSAYGLAQNLILLSPKVKRILRIPETVVEVKEPYQQIVTNLKSKLKLV